jgi:CYTH domain-containing protein
VALEIERRFLVVGEGWRHHCLWVRSLRQGYLVAAAEGITLRVRTSSPLGETGEPEVAGVGGRAEPSPEAFLTLKAPPPAGFSGPALCRLEFEYAIPLADGEELLALAAASLRKRRHGLDLSGGDWVLDVFEGDNAPLVLAEVEIASADQAVMRTTPSPAGARPSSANYCISRLEVMQTAAPEATGDSDDRPLRQPGSAPLRRQGCRRLPRLRRALWACR